jgi:hypothetical protein
MKASRGCGLRGVGMKVKSVGVGLVVACLASCTSSPKIYVINDTGQMLRGGIRDVTKIELGAEPGAQVVRGFPDHDWWLIAGGCTYRYPAIAIGDPAWVEHTKAAHASGAHDLLVRISETFTVRAYTYYRRAKSMLSQEVKVGGMPMKPERTCAAEAQSAAKN